VAVPSFTESVASQAALKLKIVLNFPPLSPRPYADTSKRDFRHLAVAPGLALPRVWTWCFFLPANICVLCNFCGNEPEGFDNCVKDICRLLSGLRRWTKTGLTEKMYADEWHSFSSSPSACKS